MTRKNYNFNLAHVISNLENKIIFGIDDEIHGELCIASFIQSNFGKIICVKVLQLFGKQNNLINRENMIIVDFLQRTITLNFCI